MAFLKMRPRTRVLAAIACGIGATLCVVRPAHGGDAKPDLPALIRETQKMSASPTRLELVWWIPVEYWRVANAGNPAVSEELKAQVEKVLHNYTLIAVVDADVGLFGSMAFRSKPRIARSLALVDKDGETIAALAEDRVDRDARNLVAAMQPILAGALGNLGKSMHFFFFPAVNSKGRRIAQAKEEGRFTVKLGKTEFSWRLPLGALLPPKICPKCRAKLSGAFKFCPWDGARLPATKHEGTKQGADAKP